MTGIGKLIDSLSTGDPDETCTVVLDHLSPPKKWRDLFGPLVRDECRRRLREVARVPERSCGSVGAAMSATTAPDERSKFLDGHFAVGDGRFISWGKATADDHRARIDMLRGLRDGIDRTIGQHAEAIALIEAAGATCLLDVPTLPEGFAA